MRAALSALPEGCAAVQVREKELSSRDLVALCRALLPICHSHRSCLLVNDRCDVALSAGLDGVHLAQSSVEAADARALLGPAAILGVSCHDLGEIDAVRGAASYVAFGPVYPPRSKHSALPPRGTAGLRAAVARGVPVFALGGLTPENAGEVRAQAAHGLAVIGAGLGADDPATAVASLWEAWRGNLGG